MGGVGEGVGLLLFYTLERALFNRMVISLSMNPHLVRMAIAFWLVLEEIIVYHHQHIHLTRIIYSFDDTAIRAIFQETLSCLHHYCIQPKAVHTYKPTHVVGSSSSSSIYSSYDDDDDHGGGDAPPLQIFSSILGEPVSPRFLLLYYNHEFIYRRFVHVMATICNHIFGENAAIEVVVLDHVLVASGATKSLIDAPTTTTHRHHHRVLTTPSNPKATEFVPAVPTRTMFLTFSRGYPLTPREILHFFTTKWGDVVEDVMVEEAGGGRPALYGLATLKSDSLIPLILNCQSKAKFLVNGKHLWARIYVPTRPPGP